MKRAVVISVIPLAMVLMAVNSASENGRAGYTMSPGESSCNTAGCHSSFAMNSGGGSVVISAPSMPGWEYTPGQTYAINVTVSKTGQKVFGFGFEALDSTGKNAGTLSITNTAQTRLLNAVVSGTSRTNVVHVSDGGLTNDSHTFTFNWKAPASSVKVTFYASGNAANRNGTTSGDYIYTTSQAIVPLTIGMGDIASSGNYLSVFPNPAKGRIKLDYNIRGNVRAELYDIHGKFTAELFNEACEGEMSGKEVFLPADLPGGIYLVRLTVDEETAAVKKLAIL